MVVVLSVQDNLCFGKENSTVIGLFIGVMIIIVGLTELLGDTISWLNWDTLWPYIVIILGLLIIGNSLYKRQ